MTAVEKYLPAYRRALDNHERKHPHWRIEVLVSLIKWSLRSLQRYIEDDRESKITRDEPLVELHYPVGWNWKPRGECDIARGGHIFGKITKKNTAGKRTAVRTLSKIMVNQLNATALADVTHWAWYEKLNNYYTPVLPAELSGKLNAIKDKRARREAFDELVRPFSIGAASIDYGDMKFKDGAWLPKQVTRELANIGNLMDIPRIAFSAEVNGRQIEMCLVFQIHPLIADYDEKKAYHPITVGLFIEPQFSGGNIVTQTPADWPRSDRETLWTGILHSVDQIVGKLVPASESEESVILSVNARLKVPANWWRPENRSAAIKQIADAHSVAGELIGISVQAAGSGIEKHGHDACPVCGWIHDTGFTQIKIGGFEAVSLSGLLPDIVRLVHQAHEKGFAGVSTKDGDLLKTCGGYRHPCKAFDDLKRRREYKLLFDTRKRGFISLRGAVGINRNKSEAGSE